MTNLTKIQLDIFNNVTNNMSDLVFNNVEQFTNETRRKARQGITRVSNFGNKTYYLATDYINELNNHFMSMASNISDKPGNLFTIVSERALNISNSTYNKMTHIG